MSNDLYTKAANRALKELAIDGLKNFAHNRYRLSHRDSLQADSCGNLLAAGPNTELRGHNYCPKFGMFARMNIFDILAACFEKDAIELLLASAGNGYQFWAIVRDLFNASPAGYRSNQDLPLPCPRSELQARLDWMRPFGFSSPSNDWKLQQFNLRLAAGFDVDKLEPAYAAELLEQGILLLYVPQQYTFSACLVVSPLIRKLVPGYQVPAAVDRKFWTAD